MGNQDKLPLPAFQKTGKPSYRDNIKIVCRLIKEKHVRFGDKQLGEIQADLKASGQVKGMTRQIRRRKPESHQYRLSFIRFIPAVIRGFKTETPFFQRRILAELKVLGKIAYDIIVGNTDDTRVRLFLADYDSEKGRLPMPVPPHKPDPLPGVNGKTDVVKYDLCPICL
jgi:hypothetical protein